MASEWRETTLGDVIELKRGYDLPQKERKPGNVPLVSSSGVSDKHSVAMVKGPGVVTGRYGTIGEVFFVEEDFWPLNTTLYVRDFKGNDPRFISYFLRGVNFHAYTDKAAVPGVNRNDLHLAEVVFPNDVGEQRAIAETLGALDDRIDNLRQTNATLEAIAAALFKSWFVDFDGVAQEDMQESELGLIPKGWQVVPLLEVCDLQGGSQPPAKEFITEPREGYVRLLQIRDFGTDAHMTYIPENKKLRLATEDDVLIGRYGSANGDQRKDSLGRICRGLSGAYNVALMKLAPNLLGREFLLQIISSNRFYSYLQGVSTKAVQSGFSKQELALFKITIPPRELASQYEEFGLIIWEKQKQLIQQATLLAALRDTLLPRLMSGRLKIA